MAQLTVTPWLAWVVTGLWKVVSPVIGIRLPLSSIEVTRVGLRDVFLTSFVVVVIREGHRTPLVSLPRAMMVQVVFRRVSRWVVVCREVLLPVVVALRMF